MEVGDRLVQAECVPESDARLKAGLGKLWRAYNYAREVACDPWDFAVEIQDLRAADLDNSDFRWLVCKGYVEHAGEVRGPSADRRAYRPTGRLHFCKRSCFVLTAAGADFVDQLLARLAVANGTPEPTADPASKGRGRPRWDRERQELTVGGVLVKRFKVPAVNQEMILAAFEEEGWPPRIDDPIPPKGDTEARRLHDTINSLNGCHLQTLIRFLGDGTG
jgi:hypothetical protein